MIYCILLVISFVVSVVSIYFLRKFATKHHFYDEPGENKIHKKPVPYFGGVGIFLGFILGLVFARLFHQVSGLQATGIIIGSIVILFLGFWDDLRWKKVENPVFKLFCQFLAGALIVFILTKIGVNFKFSLSPIVAGFYVVGTMNAINVDDGMDGLAGGMVGLSLIGFIILSFISQATFPLILCLSLLGGILGFLIYNWKPASIFMGDNGSHFLGFSLAILAIMFSGHPVYNLKQFVGPLLIIGFPIIDIGWVIIKRLVQGKSPFSKGRNYLYDQMHFKLGFSIKKTVLICHLFQIILVTSGVLIYCL